MSVFIPSNDTAKLLSKFLDPNLNFNARIPFFQTVHKK